jgi:hypothetical protein
MGTTIHYGPAKGEVVPDGWIVPAKSVDAQRPNLAELFRDTKEALLTWTAG